MKAYILIAILIGLGASQIQVTSQTICGCTQLTNQNDCNTFPGCEWANNSCSQSSCIQLNQPSCLKASQYCQWNIKDETPKCSSFRSCENLVAINNQECIQQNVLCLGFDSNSKQCLYYNQISSNCIDFPQTTCSYNFGKDGPCYWTNNNCQVINNCSMVTQQDQCYQLNYFKSEYPQGIVCYWNQANTQCQAITSCSHFNSEDTCKYYFTSMTSIILNVCYWSQNTTPPSCVPVTNLNNLTSQNCLANTGLLFRWYGQQDKDNQGFCGPCKQIYLKTRTQCTCSDYLLQTDCNSQNTLCQWNTETQTCTLNTCSNIVMQNICITVSGCYWSFNTYSCQTLNNCTDLTFKVSAIGCAAQSLQCAGYTSGTCNSTSAIVSTCSNQYYQENCSQFISSQGLCVWSVSNNSCSILQYCSQITDAPICGSWQNQCTWNASISQCQQMTCAMIKKQQNCTYILTKFQQTQYQLCRWNNSIGIQGICENAYSALLQTSKTCVNATGNTFRWSTNNASAGMCVSCGTNQLAFQTLSSCQCQQFWSQDNCTNSGFCTFNITSNICQPSPCTSFENQITCASLSTCYWNNNYCAQFTSCSDLPPAANQLECVSMNASCKGISNKICQSYPTSTCSAMYTANDSCFNNIGIDGVCFLSTTGQTTQCIGFSQCTLAQNETLCLRNQFSCQWNTVNNQCSQITCASFQTELNCKFYLPNPLSSEIIPCYWNKTNNTCVIADDILTSLNQNTCALNTYNTYSWVSISQGYCVKCQEQVTLPNQCDCTFLSQYDCSQALECYWNNSFCQQLECPQIFQKNVCASQIGCMWNNNQCQVFNGQCGNLLGKSQYQCMAQNVYCVGSNGIQCNKQLQNCDENIEQASCIATALGRDGVCYWNNQKMKCIAYYACNQLPEFECRFRSKSCYWNQQNCQALTCSTLYQQFGYCTYVISLTSINSMQVCTLVNNQCAQIQDPFALPSDQCFRNTNKTARWIPQKYGDRGICYSCSANMVPLYSPSICQCYQYTTQNECLESPRSCVWNQQQQCTVQSCVNIYANQACAQTVGCGWNNGACENFTSCDSISGLGFNIENCLSYSIQCKGYNGKTCTEYPENSCSALQTAKTCNGNFGSDGPCIWNLAGKGSCKGIQICADILLPKICSYYKNLCMLVDDQCEQLTCSYFTSPASCKYVISSFLTGEVQLCQWSTVSQSCINLITSPSLNSINCSVNTGYTYRWVHNNNGDGYCTQCFFNSIYVPGQCDCSQLIYKNDCLSNPFCSYSTALYTPNCYNKPCSEIILQDLCRFNPKCSWSATQELCQPFTKCSNLVGINYGECASYSIFCAAITQTKTTLQDKYYCAQTQTQCNTVTSSASECENIIILKGICYFNTSTQKCTLATSCSQITSQTRCQQLIHSCYWLQPTGQTTQGSCITTQCNYFTNKLECTYVLTTLSTTAPSSSNVIQCQWLSTNSCQKTTNILTTLNSNNCYTNTFMMSRWIPTTTDSGYCTTCNQYTASKSFDSICSCTELSQYECILASPQCSYNSTSSKCTIQKCSSITSKYQCAANQNCIYIGSTCYEYSSSSTGCKNITNPKSATDCYTSSINCPVFTLNASNNSNSTNNCSATTQCKYLNQTQCENHNSEVCVWNNNNKKCNIISNCNQITEVALCSLQTSRCQWSVVFNSCITQSCNSYISQSDCTYVYTSYSPGDIALCSWDDTYNECRSAPFSILDSSNYNQANSTQCFVSTGHVYHLDGNECKMCFQTILNILLITVLLLLI